MLPWGRVYTGLVVLAMLSACGGGGGLAPGGVASDRLLGGGTVSFTVDFGTVGRAQGILGSVDLSRADRVVADLLDAGTLSPIHPQTVVQRQFGLERQTVVIQQVCPGSHVLRLYLQDSQGANLWMDEAPALVSPGQVTTVAFDMDRTPTVTLTAPSQGQTVFGVITIQAVAQDDVGVTQVEFFLDGVPLGSDPAPPYQQTWNTGSVPDGAHMVQAVVRDTAGQSASHAVNVNVSNGVDNPPTVSLTAPTQGQNVSGLVSLEATAADDVGVTRVDFLVEGGLLGSDALPPYQLSWDTTTVADGVRQVQAVAHDTAGQASPPHTITVDVSNVVDNPPTVSITYPSNGQDIGGTITVEATATDDVGVSQVEFSVNGTPVGTDFTPPYQQGWDTTTLADGTYPVTAVARDTSGQPSTPHTITVDIVNSLPRNVDRSSLDSAGVQANNDNTWPSISQDGRYVAFESTATNLVPGDTNAMKDVFVHDRQTGETTRVSVSSSGVQGNGTSGVAGGVTLSADGRFVAFRSSATNLVAGDTNGQGDIFVHDRRTGQTRRVSVDSLGSQANSWSDRPTISADGRFVAFEAWATNLVPGDTNGASDLFVHDTQTGQTTRVNVDSLGNQANFGIVGAFLTLSADGRFVAFDSNATNLVSGDTNAQVDIFVHDRQTGETRRVSVDSTGAQGNSDSWDYPCISPDGRYVAFASDASNLVPGDTNSTTDIFVHDRQTGETRRASLDSAGLEANGYSYRASITAGGRYVLFFSNASNLVAGDTNFVDDIFVHDRQTGQTVRLSEDASGNQANALSLDQCSLSADGCFAVFPSWADNLVPNDTNSATDVFVARNILAPPAQVWDGADDFTIAVNPNGAWSYGFCPPGGLGTDPNLFNDGRIDPPTGMGAWGPSPGAWNNPTMVHNGTGADYWQPVDRILWKAGDLSLHPGQLGAYSVLRWTAPLGGTYQVLIRFQLIDQDAQTTDVHVRLNNSTALFDGICQFYGNPQTFTVSSIALNQGDTLDFVVGYNGVWVDDSTATVARILLLP